MKMLFRFIEVIVIAGLVVYGVQMLPEEFLSHEKSLNKVIGLNKETAGKETKLNPADTLFLNSLKRLKELTEVLTDSCSSHPYFSSVQFTNKRKYQSIILELHEKCTP